MPTKDEGKMEKEKVIESLIDGICGECVGKQENQSYYQAIVKSDIFQEWTKYAEKNHLFDMPESIECGWMSDSHFNAFIDFVKEKGAEEASHGIC